jgi:iron complex outermembrane recepter protein
MKRVYGGILCVFLSGWAMAAAAEEPEQTVDLGPVVVTATRQEEASLRIPSLVTVITKEEIKKSGAKDVGDILNTETGIWVANTSGSTPFGNLIDGRGFNNGGGNGSRMLVQIDGRRVNLADTSNPDWTSIPIDSIERIEIVRGASSSLYGDNAIAGVINIITKEAGPEPVTELSLDHGSYDFWKRAASISESTGSLSYYLYGGYESSDGYRDNSDYRASNYVGNFGYEMTPYTTFHFRTGYVSNDHLLPGSLTQDEIDTLGPRASVTPGDHAATHQSDYDARLESYLNKENWIEISGGQILRGEDFQVTFPGAGISDSANDTRSSTVAVKYQATAPLAGLENHLLLGSDLLKETVNSPSSFIDTTGIVFPDSVHYERRVIGAYAHEELSIRPSLIVTLSGRMDWSNFQYDQESSGVSGERSFRIWSPKAGLTYVTTSSSSIYATWSKGFRFPNRDELTGFFGFTPQLDPERATTIEFGGKVHAGQAEEAGVTIYRTQVDNEILYVPPPVGSTAFGENENIPEVRHEGIEFSEVSRPNDTLRLGGSYTVARSWIVEGPFDGKNLPVTPKHSGSMTVDWGRNKGPGLSIIGRFSGKQILANDLANEQEKLPGYAVWSARMRYKGESLDWYFGVNNVFNHKYDAFGGVGGGGSTAFGDRIGLNPAPERNMVGGATVRF